jgi:mannosyltransferase OCH1-like enzyme
MKVFQIYISENNQPMGAILDSYVESVRKSFNYLEHVLLDNHQIEEFLKENYDKEVLCTYKKLRPFAYKADLARLCLLKTVGGWYVDVGFKATVRINAVHENINLIVLRDTMRYSEVSWACANNLIYAKPQHPAICRAIEIIVENCKNEYYGINQLSPTGPYVLGQAIAENGPNKQTIFGDFLELTPNHINKNRAAVLPDGTIIAMYKPSMKQGLRQDLKEIGAEGTNDYEAMWHSRDIYNNP